MYNVHVHVHVQSHIHLYILEAWHVQMYDIHCSRKFLQGSQFGDVTNSVKIAELIAPELIAHQFTLIETPMPMALRIHVAKFKLERYFTKILMSTKVTPIQYVHVYVLGHCSTCTYSCESCMESLRHPYLLETVNDGRFICEPALLLLDEKMGQSHSLVLKLLTLDLGSGSLFSGKDLSLYKKTAKERHNLQLR